MDTPRVTLTQAIAVGSVFIPLIAILGVTIHNAGKSESDLKELEARLVREIQQVDLNSANRRMESHVELVRLHEIQAAQIEQNRQDIRDVRVRLDGR